MKPSKEMVQKYLQQQNNLLSNSEHQLNNDFINRQEHSTFSKLNTGQNNLFSFNPINSTNKMTSSSIYSSANENQEEQIKNLLKLNYHDQLKDMIQFNQLNGAHSAFNLVNTSSTKKSIYQTTNNQLHNSMMSDETFAEDLSDEHSPNDDEYISDEQMMSEEEDEQPLDFSIKSKKEDNDKKSTELNSIYSLGNRATIDQVDSEYAINFNSNNLTNSKFHPTSMFNSFNQTAALQFYASTLKGFQNQSPVNQFNNNSTLNALMNPCLLAESQLNQNNQNNNLIHSEPSSPEEGLSSASSTSSRSSSQGYYSGSSLNGNLNGNFNQNITQSIYSNVFNQSFNNSKSFLQNSIPPSYHQSSLNFNKQTFNKNSNNNQLRPSVIVSNNSTKTKNSLSNNKNDTIDNCSKLSSFTNLSTTDKIVDDSIDEHFRLSLGSSYNKMLNNQSTPSKDTFKNRKQNSPSIADHFNRPLNDNSTETVIDSSTSVDDHFAKALGETWFKLKKDSPSS